MGIINIDLLKPWGSSPKTDKYGFPIGGPSGGSGGSGGDGESGEGGSGGQLDVITDLIGPYL